MTTQLEDRIRASLHRTAESMTVPDVLPGDRLIRVAPRAERSRWGRTLLVAASVVVLGGTAFAVQQRRDGSPASVTPGAGGPTHHFATPTVAMDAASIEVTAGGRTSTPADVTVQGDPGVPNEFTTLELSWHDGVEQRLYIYFRSDGVDWWAYEIRTYDGGEWFDPAATGEFFRSPLGSAFVGDLDLPNLHIEGLRIQAFLRPDVCEAPTAPLALVADYPIVQDVAGGEYGATFQVVDTATCTALPVADYAWDFAAADPSIVSIDADQLADYPATKFRVGLHLLAEGATTITATARNQASEVVDSAVMDVVVRPAPADPTAADTTTLPGTGAPTG